MVRTLRSGYGLVLVALMAAALMGVFLMSQNSDNPNNLPVPRPPDAVSGEVIGGTLGKDGDVTVSQELDGRVVVEKASSDLQLVVSTKSGWCEMTLFDPNMPPSQSHNGWYVIAADNIDNPHKKGTPCFDDENLTWDRLLDALFDFPPGRVQLKEITRELIEAYLKYGKIPLD